MMPPPEGNDSRFPAREIDGVLYRLATSSDAAGVSELMLREFCTRMPLYRHVGATDASDVAWTLSFLPVILGAGESLVAADPSTGQLLGARLSAIERRSDPEHLRRPPLATDTELAARYPKEGCVMRFVDRLLTEAAYFARYPSVDRAMAARFLTVRETHGGRGIGRRLMECSIELARGLGAQLIVGATQSYYSQRIYEVLGFQRVHAISIVDYMDPATGDRPFLGLAGTIHKEAVFHALRLD